MTAHGPFLCCCYYCCCTVLICQPDWHGACETVLDLGILSAHDMTLERRRLLWYICQRASMAPERRGLLVDILQPTGMAAAACSPVFYVRSWPIHSRRWLGFPRVNCLQSGDGLENQPVAFCCHIRFMQGPVWSTTTAPCLVCSSLVLFSCLVPLFCPASGAVFDCICFGRERKFGRIRTLRSYRSLGEPALMKYNVFGEPSANHELTTLGH